MLFIPGLHRRQRWTSRDVNLISVGSYSVTDFEPALGETGKRSVTR